MTSYHLAAIGVVVAGFSGPAAGSAAGGPGGVVAGGAAAGAAAAGAGVSGAGAGGGGGAGACADATDSQATTSNPTSVKRKLRIFMAFSSGSPSSTNTTPVLRSRERSSGTACRRDSCETQTQTTDVSDHAQRKARTITLRDE